MLTVTRFREEGLMTDKGGLTSFEQLECWRACRDVRRFIQQVTGGFPAAERYILTQDMIRAARSTTYNIAEGFGRFHFQEKMQFCRQARGSLTELLDQLLTAKDELYVTDAELKVGRELIGKSLALLNGYINYLSRAKQSQGYSN